jgi:hypothetical protein
VVVAPDKVGGPATILAWSWSDPTDQGYIAGLSLALAVATILGGWLWKRRVENSRSLVVTWVAFYDRLNRGREFVFRVHIRNRTQQEREVTWQLPTPPGYPPIVDRGRVEVWAAGAPHMIVVSPRPVSPAGRIELYFIFAAINLGSGTISIDLEESSDSPYQHYRGRPGFPISVEERVPSGWISLVRTAREEFVASVLTQALERPRTSHLTHDRIVRFFDLVQEGRLTIMLGAMFQSFEGYSPEERLYLLSAAKARHVSVEWAERSTPSVGWRRWLPL